MRSIKEGLRTINRPNKKSLNSFIIAILLTVSAFMGWYGNNHSQHSWDTIPYVALLLSLDSVSAENLHGETYRRLEATLPNEVYKFLISSTPFRKQVYKNPSELRKILPFWAIKPLYLWTSFGIYKLGVDIVQATTVVSTLSTVLLYLLLNAWILRHFNNYTGIAVAAICAIASGLPHYLGLARPDGLSALFIFSCIFILIEYKNTWLAALFAVVAIVARPDNIIIACLICLYIAIAAPGTSVNRDRITGTISLLSAILVYAIIQVTSEGYGWKTTFYIAFIEDPSIALLQQELTLSPLTYIKVLYWSTLQSIATLPFMLFVLFNTIGFIVSQNSFGHDDHKPRILLLLVATNIIHWFAYPSFELRFFVASYLAIACIMIILLKDKLGFIQIHGHTVKLG